MNSYNSQADARLSLRDMHQGQTSIFFGLNPVPRLLVGSKFELSNRVPWVAQMLMQINEENGLELPVPYAIAGCLYHRDIKMRVSHLLSTTAPSVNVG